MRFGFDTGDRSVDHSRRRMLRLALGCSAGLIAGPAMARTVSEPERQLSFYNTHTGESLRTVYRADGVYLPESLQEIAHILRDHRADQVGPVDTELLDLVYALRQRVESKRTIEIICGYRSPATNEYLRATSSGVAKHSLHMEGRAMDLRLPKVTLANLHRAAIDMRKGGVGYYPKSNFIHVDSGPVRSW